MQVLDPKPDLNSLSQKLRVNSHVIQLHNPIKFLLKIFKTNHITNQLPCLLLCTKMR